MRWFNLAKLQMSLFHFEYAVFPICLFCIHGFYRQRLLINSIILLRNKAFQLVWDSYMFGGIYENKMFVSRNGSRHDGCMPCRMFENTCR